MRLSSREIGGGIPNTGNGGQPQNQAGDFMCGAEKIRRKVTPAKRGSIKINPPPKTKLPIMSFLKRWLKELTGIYW